MKGFLTSEAFLFYYTTFVVFVAYVGGLYGQSILLNVPAKPSATGNTFIDAASNIIAPFTYFIALMLTDVAGGPEFKAAFAVIITPAVVLLIFVLAKHLPVIGSG
jgi:hypothetical protein